MAEPVLHLFDYVDNPSSGTVGGILMKEDNMGTIMEPVVESVPHSFDSANDP